MTSPPMEEQDAAKPKDNSQRASLCHMFLSSETVLCASLSSQHPAAAASFPLSFICYYGPQKQASS